MKYRLSVGNFLFSARKLCAENFVKLVCVSLLLSVGCKEEPRSPFKEVINNPETASEQVETNGVSGVAPQQLVPTETPLLEKTMDGAKTPNGDELSIPSTNAVETVDTTKTESALQEQSQSNLALPEQPAQTGDARQIEETTNNAEASDLTSAVAEIIETAEIVPVDAEQSQIEKAVQEHEKQTEKVEDKVAGQSAEPQKEETGLNTATSVEPETAIPASEVKTKGDEDKAGETAGKPSPFVGLNSVLISPEEAEETFLLALNYYEGKNDEERDVAKACDYFEKAAAAGHHRSMFNLGVLTMIGEADKDLSAEERELKAVMWFEKAASLGNADALFNLGVHYTKGQGVEKDYKKAAEYFQAAADAGSPDATYQLALLYVTGIGVEKDEKKAAELFKNVAEMGYPSAQANLGVFYLKGKGVEKDTEQAEKWLLKAAKQGNATAQFNLGVMYARGANGKTNLVEAYKWTALAEILGDKMAAENRLALLPDLSPKQLAEAIRAVSDFTYEKIRELHSEGILQIRTDMDMPGREAATEEKVTVTEQKPETAPGTSEPVVLEDSILPTATRPILENPLEPVKSTDQPK